MIKKLVEKLVQNSIKLTRHQRPQSNQSRCLREFKSIYINSGPEQEIKSSMDSTLSTGYDEEVRSRAHAVCKENLGGAWAKISPSEISLMPIR